MEALSLFSRSQFTVWRTAAELLPNFLARDRFVRQLGRLIYERLQEKKIARVQPKAGSVVASLPALEEVLQFFRDAGYAKGYKISTSTELGGDSTVVFDSFDDEALQSGASIDCLVSVYEPATLGASLQITGEQSRFAPDFVSPTLAAVWQGMNVRWETFFVDPEYRPNPKDYFPNEQLLQYTLQMMA